MTATGYGSKSYGYTSARGIVAAHGLVTATTVDPGVGHLNLTTTTSYEAPSASGYLRRTARLLPKGHGVADVYYASGAAPLASNCPGMGNATAQRGRLKTTGGSGAPTTTSFVYDTAGRVAGVKNTG